MFVVVSVCSKETDTNSKVDTFSSQYTIHTSLRFGKFCSFVRTSNWGSFKILCMRRLFIMFIARSLYAMISAAILLRTINPRVSACSLIVANSRRRVSSIFPSRYFQPPPGLNAMDNNDAIVVGVFVVFSGTCGG